MIKKIIVMMVNHTESMIDLCKASTNTITISPGERIQLPFTAKGWIHGHSSNGSFVICKDYEDFSFKTWGDFILKLQKSNNEFTFEVLKKT